MYITDTDRYLSVYIIDLTNEILYIFFSVLNIHVIRVEQYRNKFVILQFVTGIYHSLVKLSD